MAHILHIHSHVSKSITYNIIVDLPGDRSCAQIFQIKIQFQMRTSEFNLLLN